ncbi:HAMP domain-containing histidine kinase [Micrococcaceae bacterium RIT802]|nr:HAMP domain-containing histidine kinase [Micrococcaceae bacterium RIT 802]
MSRTSTGGPGAWEASAMRHAALRVGWQLAAVTAAVVLVVLAIGGTYIALHAGTSPGGDGEPQVRISLEVVDLLQLLILGGVAGIVLSGIVGMLSARRAVRPLGATLEVQRRFAQDVSHELRTPLTVLDARLQLLQRRAGAGHEFAAELDTLRRDSARLARVIDDLLSTVDGGARAETDRPADLDDLAAKAVRELGVLAAPRGVELRHVPAEGPLPVPLGEVAVRRILTGLIDNATKYTPSGGTVTVTTERHGGTARLTVTDTGSGISGIEPQRIFDRHAHGAAGESGTPRSTGIGLSLAREMVVRAGGTIGVLATGAGGTSLRVELPVNPQA